MTTRSSILVIKLDGELEIGRKAEVRQALVVDPAATGILVDFADVTYADSTTLAEMLRFRTETAAAKIPVAIVIASRQFARLLQYAGLGEAFAIFNDRGSALTYLAGEQLA